MDKLAHNKKQRTDKAFALCGVSIFVCPYCNSERTKKLKTLHACLECQGTFLANES